jgi:hypothetical protein
MTNGGLSGRAFFSGLRDWLQSDFGEKLVTIGGVPVRVQLLGLLAAPVRASLPDSRLDSPAILAVIEAVP